MNDRRKVCLNRCVLGVVLLHLLDELFRTVHSQFYRFFPPSWKNGIFHGKLVSFCQVFV